MKSILQCSVMPFQSYELSPSILDSVPTQQKKIHKILTYVPKISRVNQNLNNRGPKQRYNL